MREPLDVVQLARQLRELLDHPPGGPGSLWGVLQRREVAQTWYGNARRYFRESVLQAAALDPKALPAGRCRWCVAKAHASRMGVEDPGFAGLRSDRELLGAPCGECLHRWRSEAVRRVAAGSAARRVAAAGRRRTVHTPPVRPLDVKALAAGLQRYGTMPCPGCSRNDRLIWHEKATCPRLKLGIRQ